MLNRIVLAAAPLMLVTACGEAGEAEIVEVEASEVGVGEGDAAGETSNAEMPPVNADALDTVDFTGTYAMWGPDGARSTLQLDREGDTYIYRDSAGGQQSGTFRRLDTNRIMIDDFEGQPAYFSVAEGAIYRLAGETTPYNEISTAGMYRRESAPVQGN